MDSTPPSLFEQVEAKTSETHTIAISLVNYQQVELDSNDKPTNLGKLIDEKDIIKFEVTPITPEIDEAADKITSGETPPALFEERPDQKIGVVKVQVGYDYNDPKYLAEMAKLERKREIFICLMCCHALHESTPGDDIEKKIETAKKKIARPIINSLFNAIINIGAYHDQAEAFFLDVASDSPNSNDSETEPPKDETQKS